MQERSAPFPGLAHLPCFEGLRALAASAVVVHHAAAVRASLLKVATPATSTAAVLDLGVAVFFVISGFLIYRPFARAHLDGSRPSRLSTYLWQRALRIFPAYWLALTGLWTLGVIDLGPAGAAWRYYALVHVYDARSVFQGIVQAWSLATEITFYLFVPVWAAVLRRVARPGRPALVAELAGVGGLVLAGYVSRAAFSATDRVWAGPDVTMRAVSFTWLPNNIDLFALGMGLAVLSLAVERGLLPVRWAEAAGRWPALWWVGAASLFCWYAWSVGPPPFRVGYADLVWQRRQLVYGAIGVGLLLPAVFGDQRAGLIRRALQWSPVAWVGTVSYGLYLCTTTGSRRCRTGSTLLRRPPTWPRCSPSGSVSAWPAPQPACSASNAH
ncbi:MAG: acyltransferase [Acidimicrobiales bacterium]